MKTFSILGDSISTFKGYIPEGYDCFFPLDGYSVTKVEQTWWRLFMEKTGYELLMNDSYSGSRISKTGVEHEHSSAFMENRRIDILPPSDVLIVFGGTNDFGQEQCQATLKRFTKAYTILVRKLMEKGIFKDIYFCTPLTRTDFTKTQKNDRGWTQEDLARTVKECVQKRQDGHLHVIDLAALPIKQGDGLLEDNLHPTISGMEMLAETIARSMSD